MPHSPSMRPVGGPGAIIPHEANAGLSAARPSLRQLLTVAHGDGDHHGHPLHSGEGPPSDGWPQPDTNWPAAIEMIRDVGSRMRQARRYAQDVVSQSNDVVESTLRQLEDTERRLRLTEAAAQDAVRRAEQAEAAARLADNRARRAEEEAELARMKLAEAQTWLKRLYSSVQVEFRDIAEDRR